MPVCVLLLKGEKKRKKGRMRKNEQSELCGFLWFHLTCDPKAPHIWFLTEFPFNQRFRSHPICVHSVDQWQKDKNRNKKNGKGETKKQIPFERSLIIPAEINPWDLISSILNKSRETEMEVCQSVFCWWETTKKRTHPKSDTLALPVSEIRMFLAAKSLWTTFSIARWVIFPKRRVKKEKQSVNKLWWWKREEKWLFFVLLLWQCLLHIWSFVSCQSLCFDLGEFVPDFHNHTTLCDKGKIRKQKKCDWKK